MKRILCLPLAGALACAVAATPPPQPTAPAASASSTLATLDELERPLNPADASVGEATAERTREAIALIGAGRVSTGQDFVRAARLVQLADIDFEAARVRYELLLAAAALHVDAAEPLLAREWNRLLDSLGRPLRIEMGRETMPQRLPLDPAPGAVQNIFRDPASARAQAKTATRNPEMKAIVDSDQADRRGNATTEDWKAISARDAEREARTLALLNGGALRTASDFANAALVMQHSDGFLGYETAHELAVCALLLGDRSFGRWLVAATYDRMLGSIGHAQRFGTQYRGFGGKTSLVRVDETGICDAERTALGCPALGAAKGRNLDKTTEPANQLVEVNVARGPNGRMRDPEYGVSAALPVPWRVSNAFRWGERQTTVQFEVDGEPEQKPGLYFKVYGSPQPLAEDALLAWYREEAAKKETSRREDFESYKNRPDSLAVRKLGGKTMFSWIADYTDDGGKHIEYMINLRTPVVNAFLFAKAPASQLAALQASADAFMASLTVPDATP